MHLLVLHYGAAILRMRPIGRHETEPRVGPFVRENADHAVQMRPALMVRPNFGHHYPVAGTVISRIASRTYCALQGDRIASTRTFGTM